MFRYWYWADMENPQLPEWDVCGIKLHGTIDKVSYTSKSAFDCVDFYVENGHNTFICHTSGRMPHAKVERGVILAEQFPEANFILAHNGTTSLEQNLEWWDSIRYLPDNVYFDTSAVKSDFSLMASYDVVGARKLIFGSDWPWMCPMASVAMIEDMPITDMEKEYIFSGNIQRLCNI